MITGDFVIFVEYGFRTQMRVMTIPKLKKKFQEKNNRFALPKESVKKIRLVSAKLQLSKAKVSAIEKSRKI